MNLGELIVDLSLDYAEFNQSLEQAKKAASSAAANIEKSFQKLSLTVEVDDSALYDLNKHLDLKYKHFKEVNQYFKNNPLTPTVDDGELTELNKLLQELTRTDHIINIQQNIDIKLQDSSKRDIAKSVADGVEDGVLNAVDNVASKIEDTIADAISRGMKAGGGSSDQMSTAVVEELKKGFDGIMDTVGSQMIDQAMSIVLKPGRDLLTGFFEGVSTDFGIQISKGLQASLQKNSGINMNDVGEKAGDGFLKAFGVKIKQGNKSGIQDLGQEIIKDAVKSVASGSLENMISTGVKMAVNAAKNAVTTELIPLPPLPLPPAKQKQGQRELEPVPVNIPQQAQRVSRIAVDTPELKTPFVKAQEQSRDFSYSLEDVLNSKFSGKNLKELTDKITKIKTAHQALHKTLLNLMEQARTSGDFRAIEAIYLGYQTDGKKAIDEINRLIAEMKQGGATQEEINSISQAKSPITKATGKSSKLSQLYQRSKRESEKAEFVGDAAVGIGLDVIAGLHESLGKGQFAKLATENALAYLAAIKKTFGIQSPSKVMMEVGLNIIAGLKQGLDGNIEQVAQSAISIKDKVVKAFSGKNFDFKGIFNSLKNLDFAAIGLNLIQSFVKRFSDGKGLFGKVINAFSHIIPLIKNVFGIASPSKVMMEIGLDFGRGFQNGAIASLTLANKRIAEKMRETVYNNPNATAAQKQAVDAHLARVTNQLDRIAQAYKSGQLSDQDAMSALGKTARGNIRVGQYVGIDQQEISQEFRDSKRYVASRSKNLFKELFDSILYSASQASQTGDNRLGDYLKNFAIRFVEDFLKKQKVTGGKGDAIKDILGAAFSGNKLGFSATALKTLFGLFNPFSSWDDAFNSIPSILGQAIGSKGIGGIAKMALPLLAPLAGIAATRAGNFVSDTIQSNNAVKPGFVNDLINSLTGVNLASPTRKLPKILESFAGMFDGFNTILERMGVFSLGNSASLGALGMLAPLASIFVSSGRNLANSRVSNSGVAKVSPNEVFTNQIATNINSLGIAPGQGIKGLITQIGRTLVDSLTFKNMDLSPQLRGVVEKNKGIIDGILDGVISGILNLDLFKKKQSGILGKVIGAADAYGSGDVKGAIAKGTAAVKGVTQMIGLRIDTSQIKIAVTALLLGISAFHKAFTEEGLNLGKALIKGFKEAQSNWISVRNDIRRGVQKAIGAESLKDTWNDIAHEWGKGIVSVGRFGELFDVMGKTFRRRMLKFMDPNEREGMQGNIMSFVASISTAFAPIATFATTLIPLFAPLLPLFGALGGAALMVGKHIQGIAEAIKKVEPLQRRLNFLGGSKEAGKQEMSYALGVADKLNIPVEEGINAYSQLAIAARHTKIDTDGVRELYEGISASLSALGISGQDASLVFMAYTQILAKGKLSMEELRQQLGEKFPPAMGIFAKALGVSVSELNALVGKGAILSEDILPKVAKVLNQDYGEAAQGAEGLTVALTRLGNAGFKIAIKLTNSFGGIFASVVNMAASALGVFEKVMDELLKMAGSLTIGVTAVIGVALATILQAPPIAKHLMNVSNLLVAGIGKLMETLAPYYLGIITDIADGWLGAQNDLITNMTNGVSNIFVAIFGYINTQKRLLSDVGKGMFGEMIGELNQVNVIADIFNGIKDAVVGFFQSIPPGLVELGAMVLMFEQLQVLFKTFLGSQIFGALTGLGQIAGNFGGMFKSAFSKSSMKDLFGNTFGAIDIANTFSKGSQPNLAVQLKNELQEFGNSIGKFGTEKWANFRAGLDSARQSISSLSWQGFKDNIKSASDSVKNFGVNAWQNFTNGVKNARDAVVSALTPFTALFSPNSAVRSAARADWANAISAGFTKMKMALSALKPLLVEIGIALALFMLSRSDFSNPLQGGIDKMAKGINDAFRSMDKGFEGLSKNLDKTGTSLQKLINNLPSKGLELNIKFALGFGGQSFKTDDLTNLRNAGRFSEIPWYAKAAFGLFGDGPEKNYTETLRAINKNKVAKAAQEAQRFGIGDQITGNEVDLTIGQEQLLGQFKSLQGNSDAFRKQLISRGLTRGTVGNLMQGDTLATVKKIREIDSELFKLGQQRTKFALTNTTESRNKISELDKQLAALESKRSKVVKPFLEYEEDVKSFAKSIEESVKAIDESGDPPDVKRKLKAMLEPMKAMAKEASDIITENLPVEPLKQVYQTTISALRDFEVAYDKFQSNLSIKTANQQESLYSSGLNAGNINREASLISLREQEARKAGIEASLRLRQRSLNNLTSITNFGKTDEQKKELDELRKAIKDDNENLAKLGTDIAKARRDIRQSLVDQTKQVADYYRTAVREAQAVGIEFKKAQKTLENSRMQNKLREALIGAGDNIYTQFIEGIINIIQQTTDIQKQQLEARKQQIDYENNVQDIKLQASELQRSLPGKIIPIDSSLTEDFNNSLKNVDTTVNAINNSVKEVGNSLSNEVVEAAKKANSELDKLNQTIKTIDYNSKSWIESFSSNFADLFNVFENGFGKLGNAITDAQLKTTNWLASMATGQGLIENIAGGVKSLVSGVFGQQAGQQLEQGVKQLGNNPIGAISNFLGVNKNKILSPIQGTTTEDLLRYKPSYQQGFYGVRDKGARQHNKIDFDSKQGAEIIASLPGTATAKKWTGNSGAVFVNSILPSGQKITLEYGHLSLESIKKTFGGQLGKSIEVQAGQKLGNVIHDALSSGPHLDFGVRLNGKYIEPQKFLQDFMGGKYGSVMQSRQPTKQPVAKTFDAEPIATKNNLQSLLVKELQSGRTLASYKAGNLPASPASTIKLIVADLITDAINQGKVALQEKLTLKPGEIAEYSNIKSGQSFTISNLITRMLKDSDNTATNALINRLGGLQKVTDLAYSKGYFMTRLNNYLSLPGGGTGKVNTISAVDATNAARDLLMTSSESDKVASTALRSTRNFKFQGEVGGKIGNNSKVIGNVGIVNIGGKEYLVTSYANVNGNIASSRSLIKNATNDVVEQIQNAQSKVTPSAKRSPSVPKLPKLPNLDPRIDTKFLQDVSKIAQSVGANPEDLLKVMLYETGGTLSPSARNPRTKATGLIQFMPATAKGLGTNINALSQMTPQEQLFFVQKYLKQNSRGQKLDSFRKVLSTVFAGNPNASLGVGDGDITLGNYLKKAESRYGNTARQLTQIVVDGKAIDPDSMQSLVTEATRLKLDTANQQREINRINSGLSSEQLRENQLKQALDLGRLTTQAIRTARDTVSSTKDNSLGVEKTVAEGLFPNMNNRQKFMIQLEEYIRKLDKEEESLLNVIESTQGTINKKPQLQSAFDEAMQKYKGDPAGVANAVAANDAQLKAVIFQNAEAKKSLQLLRTNRAEMVRTFQENFDKQEFFRLRKEDLEAQGKTIEQLQQQLELTKKLQEIDPLNPLTDKIPALQRNIELLGIARDESQQLLDLQQKYYEGGGRGGNMSEESYSRQIKQIIEINNRRREGVQINADYADAVARIDRETKILAKSELIQSSTMKTLRLNNERFAIDHANGLVSITGLTNDLIIKTNELTNAYKKQDLEIRGNALLSPQEKLTERLKNFNNQQKELSNAIAENTYKKNLAELVTNPQINLDSKNKREDLLGQTDFDIRQARIDILKSRGANQFLTNRMSRELGIEREIERNNRAKEQMKIDIAKFNLDNPGLKIAADQIDKITQSMDKLSQLNIEKINGEFKTFGQTIDQIVQEQLISGLSSGFAELIQGTKSFGDVLNDLANNIINGVLNAALNALFSGIFGGGGMFGGRKGGFLGGIFGFSRGGVVPNYADGGVIGAIGDALQRERQASGVKPVLAALTPGERVLTVRQNKRFEELQMEKVLNYADGGVVGRAVPNMSFTAPSQLSSVNIDIPINVSGGDSSTSVDVPQLRNSIRSAVLAEIQRQQRPGGALNK